jgi:hypothetical protein
VRFVLRGQRADEAEQARSLRIAVAGRRRRFRVVPFAEIRFQQAAQEIFLGGEVVGDAPACDAADFRKFVEGQRAGAVVLDDLPGCGQDPGFCQW